MNLPDKYKWLNDEAGPKELKEALLLYGTLEVAGTKSNPVIMAWAKEVGVSGWYADDAVAWCGLFKGVCAKRAGWVVKSDLLSALSWAKWGTEVTKGQESLGDTLIFVRPGGGHVGYYIGENDKSFLVYGGNQSDTVGFTFIAKDRLFACRRAQWKVSQPENVRKIHLSESGVLSTNEA